MYINNPGYMTKMAAMPIYGKNPSKIFFSRTGGSISKKLGMKHRWLKYYNVYINHDPVMTLTFFYGKVNIQYSPGGFSPARPPPRTISLSPPPRNPAHLSAYNPTAEYFNPAADCGGSAEDPPVTCIIPPRVCGGFPMKSSDVIMIDR